MQNPGSRAYLQLSADYENFVQQQDGYGRQCDPGGQRIASEEVGSHGRPARASRYQGTADIGGSDCGREVRAKRVPEPEELT